MMSSVNEDTTFCQLSYDFSIFVFTDFTKHTYSKQLANWHFYQCHTTDKYNIIISVVVVSVVQWYKSRSNSIFFDTNNCLNTMLSTNYTLNGYGTFFHVNTKCFICLESIVDVYISKKSCVKCLTMPHDIANETLVYFPFGLTMKTSTLLKFYPTLEKMTNYKKHTEYIFYFSRNKILQHDDVTLMSFSNKQLVRNTYHSRLS